MCLSQLKKFQLKAHECERRSELIVVGSELITVGEMYLARRIKVPQWNLRIFYAIIVLSSTIRPAVCSDSSNTNLNSDNYASSQRRVPISGSGGGSATMGKRSSYAVISQAMSQTINNEFGSEFQSYDVCFALESCKQVVCVLVALVLSKKKVK